LVAPSDCGFDFAAQTSQARVVDRAAYVAGFAQQAQDAGATYQLGQRVLQIQPEPQGVTILTDGGRYQARAVVLAAGFGTHLTRQLGLGRVSDYVTGVQAVVATKGEEDVEVHLGRNVAPGFFSWLVPTQPNRALVGLLSRRHAPAHLTRFLQQLRGSGRITEVIQGPASWGIPLRPLKQTFQDRVLVVGDAAGQTKPTTGGGIYYSLLASEIAAEVLAEGLHQDDLSARYLSGYQCRWQDLLSQELEMGYSARRVYEFLSDQQISFLVRHAGTRRVYDELVNSPELSFDWHSRMISQVIDHPVLGGVLKLVNPLLSRIAHRSESAFDFSPASPSPADPLVKIAG
jgi:flavin-dependent dehydrogenase